MLITAISFIKAQLLTESSRQLASQFSVKGCVQTANTLVWNIVEQSLGPFLYFIRLSMKSNTFFAFIKLSFPNIRLRILNNTMSRHSHKKRKDPRRMSIGDKGNRVKGHGVLYPNDVIKKLIYNIKNYVCINLQLSTLSYRVK